MWIGFCQSNIVGMAAQFMENQQCLPFEFVIVLPCSHARGFAYLALSHGAGDQESPVNFAVLSC